MPSHLISRQRTRNLADVQENILEIPLYITAFTWPNVHNISDIKNPNAFIVGEASVVNGAFSFIDGRHRTKLLAKFIASVPIGILGEVPNMFDAAPNEIFFPDFLIPKG